MDKFAVVVLAAGLGKRMGSDLPKALAQTSERTLLEHVLLTTAALNPDRTVIVTGHQAALVEEKIAAAQSNGNIPKFKIEFVRQAKQLGTGDAVKAALSALQGVNGHVLILCADMPLISKETLLALISEHQRSKATVTLLSLVTPKPASYGRIIRDTVSKHVTQIVEAKDCTPEQLAVNEINAAIYVVDSAFLAPAVNAIENNNAQAEYYFTDIVGKAAAEGQTIAALISHNEAEVQGVNTAYEISLINETLRQRHLKSLVESGVQIQDLGSCFIDQSCSIQSGVSIGPNVQLVGKCVLETGVRIEGSAYLVDTTVRKNTLIRFGVRAEKSVIGESCAIGPFAHLRPGSELAKEVHIGNFVETKNSTLSQGAKANHLSYLGDCTVGERTNVGAGTITCNYDGIKKHQTTIGKDVFIGSNSLMVAPVVIEDGAFIGAGSVITKAVEKDALAITRSPLVTKAGWAKSRREKLPKK